MPVYSMTGYASGQHGAAQGAPAHDACRNAQADAQPAQMRLAMELRSVNSRFLDLTFRLPDELRRHEPPLRELLGRQLKRGKVELRLFIEGRDTALADPPARMLQRLEALQGQVRAWLPDAAPLSVAEALRLASGGESGLPETLHQQVPALAAQVLADFIAARQREGQRLTQLLLGRIDSLRRLSSQARPLAPQAVQAQKQRFLTRWAEALAAPAENGAPALPPEAAQERALSEATAFAIRIDVAEELDRLDAHLQEIERVLQKGGEVGKRLDFLIQELHREANTLGSKSAALELSRISVDMKVLIEQMREQVQNLE